MSLAVVASFASAYASYLFLGKGVSGYLPIPLIDLISAADRAALRAVSAFGPAGQCC